MKIIKTEIFQLTAEEEAAFDDTFRLLTELYDKSEPDGALKNACIEARKALLEIYNFYGEG